ncbi:FAD-dependent oxidoreductase [Cognatishimia sp. WU-CL00825]|uniref:NAD(P)/FAD-dependent oxidoreductase n=1 Tax=Cognatishimia sp. WU-CL00825 TaxID=3127658 RepID=UPI00310AD0D2
MTKKIVVVGAGQAGFSVCENLRKLGFSGELTLIGQESAPPYQRPPLSKGYLLGDMALERMYLRPLSFYKDQAIDLVLSNAVTEIDVAGQKVRLADGAAKAYDSLVLATGSSPIQLPAAIGGASQGVFYVRNLADVDELSRAVKPDANALIVGGGYIGLEAAAVAAKLKMKVTLVEAGERILGRVASAETAAYFRDLHQGHGVQILEGVKLEALHTENRHVVGASLSDGRKLPVDLAIVGIGIRPNVALAESAGLTLDNGILVDEQCRTSDKNIFAAGDCACFPLGDKLARLESVGHAIDQAATVARVLCGQEASYIAKPWFWSDQFDTKLQIVGLSSRYDQIVKRTSATGALSIWYYKGPKLLAVDAMNDPRAYMVAKRLIESGKSPQPSDVSNLELDLKQLLRS